MLLLCTIPSYYFTTVFFSCCSSPSPFNFMDFLGPTVPFLAFLCQYWEFYLLAALFGLHCSGVGFIDISALQGDSPSALTSARRHPANRLQNPQRSRFCCDPSLRLPSNLWLRDSSCTGPRELPTSFHSFRKRFRCSGGGRSSDAIALTRSTRSSPYIRNGHVVRYRTSQEPSV